jgi:hypothetical protein
MAIQTEQSMLHAKPIRAKKPHDTTAEENHVCYFLYDANGIESLLLSVLYDLYAKLEA